MEPKSEEAARGIGRAMRRRMKKKWKEEGGSKSLKEWAKETGQVGDAALVWIEHKRSGR